MVKKTEAYVDTSALISLADRSDTHHALFRRLFADPPRILTTPLVVAEGHGWFLKRYDPTRGLQFLAMLEAMSPLKILPVGPHEQHGGTDLLRRFADQRLTLTDAVGLFIMRDRGVSTCWSTDFHLGLTGVPLVIHQE